METNQAAEIKARDRRARDYEVEYRRGKGAWWDEMERHLVVEMVRARPGKRILDAGSGVGRIAHELARRGCLVEAVDFSFESLRVLSRTPSHPNARPAPIVGDIARALPLADSAVDAVVSCQVVHHIPGREARVVAWRELARVARPGAELAIVVYNARTGAEHEGFFSNGVHFHRYHPDELALELAEGGWTLRRILSLYRISWPGVLPAIPRFVESLMAKVQFVDDRATYLVGAATNNRDRP